MNEVILNKLIKYVELSEKFSKSADEVTKAPPDDGEYISNICCSSYQREENKPKSRGDRIMEEARKKARLADEYDEYIELRKEILDYLQSLKKITTDDIDMDDVPF